MIRLENVCHSYPGPRGQKISALENINLDIPKAGFTAIIGPNNSGKSTLGRILSGLLIPESGQVFIEGMDIALWDQTLLHEAVGLVFPHPDDQIVFPTVEDDLVFGLENLHLDSEQIEKKVTRYPPISWNGEIPTVFGTSSVGRAKTKNSHCSYGSAGITILNFG